MILCFYFLVVIIYFEIRGTGKNGKLMKLFGFNKWLRLQHWKEGGLYKTAQPELRLVLEMPRVCCRSLHGRLAAPGTAPPRALLLTLATEPPSVFPGLCRENGSVLFHLSQECSDTEPVPVSAALAGAAVADAMCFPLVHVLPLPHDIRTVLL